MKCLLSRQFFLVGLHWTSRSLPSFLGLLELEIESGVLRIRRRIVFKSTAQRTISTAQHARARRLRKRANHAPSADAEYCAGSKLRVKMAAGA